MKKINTISKKKVCLFRQTTKKIPAMFMNVLLLQFSLFLNSV